jgi:hypothetical protein
MLQHTARLLSEVGKDGRSVLNTHELRRSVADNSYVREVARQRAAAEMWLEGGGLLPFEECCEELGLQPSQARESLSRFLSACETADPGSGRYATPIRAQSLLAGQ